MVMSMYGGGFKDGVAIRGVPIALTHPGKVFWVSNSPQTLLPNQRNGSDGNPGSFNGPFATLQYALTQTVQGRGDVIIIKPGHRETIPDNSTLTLNCSGVAIVGQGAGHMRPIFIFSSATSANIQLRSSNVTLYNLVFQSTQSAVVSVFTAIRGVSATSTIDPADSPSGYGVLTTVGTVTGAFYPGQTLMGTGVTKGTYIVSQLSGTSTGIGTYLVYPSQTVTSATISAGTHDFQVVNCEFRDTTAGTNFIAIITYAATNNVSDGLYFVGNKIFSLGISGGTTAIKITATCDRVTINDNNGNWAVLNNTAAMLSVGSSSITNFEFNRNYINRPNTTTTSGLAISTSGTAWTGQCSDNRIWGLDTSAQIWIDTGTGLAFNQNFCPITGGADASGFINPAAA